jgi:hypothetical protein
MVLFALFVFYLLTAKPTNLQEAIGFALAWSGNSINRQEIYHSKSIRIPSIKQLFSKVRLQRQSHKFKISPQHLGNTSFSSKGSLSHLMSQVVAYASKHNQSGKLDFVLVRDVNRNINQNSNQADEYFRGLADQYKDKASDLDYRLAVVEFRKPDGKNQFRVQSLTQDLSLLRDWLRSLPTDSYMGSLNSPNFLNTIMSAVEKINFRSDADKHLLLMAEEADEIDDSNWKQMEREKQEKSWEKQSLNSLGSLDSLDKVKSVDRMNVDVVDIVDIDAEAQLILERVIEESKRKGIKIDVIGLNEPFYKKLAHETGGIWIPIPANKANKANKSIHPKSKLSTSWGEIKKKLPTLPTMKK